MAHSRRAEPGLPYLRADPGTDSGRHHSAVEDLVLACHVKGSSRTIRVVVVLAVRVIDLARAPDQPQQLALKSRVVV